MVYEECTAVGRYRCFCAQLSQNNHSSRHHRYWQHSLECLTGLPAAVCSVSAFLLPVSHAASGRYWRLTRFQSPQRSRYRLRVALTAGATTNAAYSPTTPSGVTSPSAASGSATAYCPTSETPNGHSVSPAPRSTPVAEPSIPSAMTLTAASRTNVTAVSIASGPGSNNSVIQGAARTTTPAVAR